MYKFSQKSLKNMEGVHPDLVKVLHEVIKRTDFTVLSGVRTLEEQAYEYAKGRTIPGDIVTNCDGIIKKSNHQIKADGYGHAVDIAPYPIDWKDLYRFGVLRGHLEAVAGRLGVTLRFGADFPSPKDYPHIELCL